MWAPNLDALAAQRPVVVWDLRGHGRTTTPAQARHYSQAACVQDMAALLDACGVATACVGGLSLGGYLSLAFYAAYPERVAALLLFDTGPGFKNEKSRRGWNDYAERTAAAFDERGLEALPDSPEVRRGPHDGTGLALAARGILAQHDSSIIDLLPHVTVPTLVLVGAQDTPFLAAAEYMTEHIPGAVKHVIEGAGHASNIDRPGAFNAEVNSFLSGVQRAG